MRTYTLTESAVCDLNQIDEFTTAAFGLRQAEKIKEVFRTAFSDLAANPGLGHFRDDLSHTANELRFFTVMRRFLVVYQKHD